MKQSILNNSKVRFNLKDLALEFEEVFQYQKESEGVNIRDYENQEAEVISLDMYTELGDKDYEYYNIKFNDGFTIEGVSGYHLTPLKTE